MRVDHFVNADTIARGLSAFHPEAVTITAGRVMLEQLHELAAARADFAFETTLATRSFEPWLTQLKRDGYLVHLVYVWLPSAEAAINRVAHRVRSGGHHVPDETLRRRYLRSLENFFHLYQPLADTWRFFNNADPGSPVLLAERTSTIEEVFDVPLWEAIRGSVRP